MGKPTRDDLVKRIKKLEKQITSGSAGATPIKPVYGFQTFTEQSPNMIFINKGGSVVYANKKCIEIMGYNWNELYAPDFDFMSLIAPESVDLIRSSLKRHLAGEDIAPYEYALINRKGEKIEAIITTKLIDYDDGKAILGIITDITERKRIEEELQYRLKFQHLITTVSSQFINLHPAQIDDEIDRTLEQIGQFADADRSYVFQFSDDQKSLSCTHEWCAEGIEPTIERIQNVPVETFPWVVKKFLHGDMVLVPRLSDLPPEAIEEKQEFEQQGIQSILAVPMMIGGKVMGFIGLDSVREEKMWAEDTSSLLKIVSQVFANALENKKPGRPCTKARSTCGRFMKRFRMPSPLSMQRMVAVLMSTVLLPD